MDNNIIENEAEIYEVNKPAIALGLDPKCTQLYRVDGETLAFVDLGLTNTSGDEEDVEPTLMAYKVKYNDNRVSYEILGQLEYESKNSGTRLHIAGIYGKNKKITKTMLKALENIAIVSEKPFKSISFDAQINTQDDYKLYGELGYKAQRQTANGNTRLIKTELTGYKQTGNYKDLYSEVMINHSGSYKIEVLMRLAEQDDVSDPNYSRYMAEEIKNNPSLYRPFSEINANASEDDDESTL